MICKKATNKKTQSGRRVRAPKWKSYMSAAALRAESFMYKYFIQRTTRRRACKTNHNLGNIQTPKTALASGFWQLSRLRTSRITRLCGTHRHDYTAGGEGRKYSLTSSWRCHFVSGRYMHSLDQPMMERLLPMLGMLQLPRRNYPTDSTRQRGPCRLQYPLGLP